MSFIPRPQEIYKHFKGNLYQIVTLAEHSESGEQLVIYQAMYGDFKTYARPLAMFVSEVDHEKYPDVQQRFRFELQGPGRERQLAGEVPIQVLAEEPTPAIDTDVTAEVTVREEQPDEEPSLDPLVLEFLDADTYEERLNILSALHNRITDEMITTMAIACDIEVNDGPLEERYDVLRNCLMTLERYECNRMR